MEKSVAIVFANLKGNLGDLAILEANLVRLSEDYPHHRVDVWTGGFLSTDQHRLRSFIDAGSPPFHLRGKTPDHPLRRLRKLIRSAGLEQFAQPFLIASARRRFADDAKIFSRYERVFVCGGDQFDATPSAAMFGTLKAIAEVNPRLSNFPFSINPRTRTANTPDRLRDGLAVIAGPVLVRDEMSRAFLEDVGIDCALGSDSVLSIARRIRSIPRSGRTPGIMVAVTKTDQTDPLYLDRLLEALAALPKSVTTVTSTPSVDQLFLDRRQAGCAYSAPDTWQELVAELRSADLVISNRYHCILLAALVGTPVLPVCNRAKVTAIKDAAELPFWAPDLGNTTPALVRSVLHGSAAQCEAIDRYLAVAESRMTAPPLEAK